MTVTAMPQTGEDSSRKKGKKGSDGTTKPGGRKKKLVVVAMVLLSAASAAYFLVLKPAPSTPPKPVEGEMLTMAEPIQINLQGGHYLKVAVAVQLTDKAHKADPSLAIDAVIETFSARQLSDLAQPEQREKAKAELLKVLEGRYHGEVMEVYFTDFVTQ